jgi:large subunit ribosomal protein L32
MAHPKRRHSKSRRNMARAHKKLTVHSLARCKHCGKTIRPHCVCPWCGYYNERRVLVIVSGKDEKKKET